MPTAANVVAVAEGSLTFKGVEVCYSSLSFNIEETSNTITTTCDWSAVKSLVTIRDKVTAVRLIMNITFPWDRTKAPRDWFPPAEGAFVLTHYTGATITGDARVRNWSAEGGEITGHREITIELASQGDYTVT